VPSCNSYCNYLSRSFSAIMSSMSTEMFHSGGLWIISPDIVVLNVFAGSKGHCMRGSMAEFPADADSVFEATLNALSTSAGNLPCCLSCTVLCNQQTCSVKFQEMAETPSPFPGTFDCLNLLAIFYSMSNHAGSGASSWLATTFTF